MSAPLDLSRDDDDREVGPHTHVYVGTDRGDECEICGELDRSNEWAYWNWVDAQHGWYLPDYDFEGGGA